MFVRLLVAAILSCSLLTHAQEPDVDELPRSEFGGLTQKQISKRIFSKERAMLNKLASLRFVTEAYMQSLGHRQAKGIDLALSEESERVIDDAYILARVEFGKVYGDKPVERVLVGEHPRRSHFILKNTGAFEHLVPEGFLSMLFVDLYSFDADRYSLIYKGRENIINTECLVFSVAPVSERDFGRFRGEIWIDSSSYGIVRAKGVFTGPYEHWYRGSGDYFHFDSWRERIGNGWWLPSATYFDERRAFHTDGNLEFHFRGYALLWQQQEKPADSPQSSKSEDNTSILEGRSTPEQNSLVARLDADGLLAAPGEEEQHLDGIVQQIARTSGRGIPKIVCRVLLTTPAEIFAVGNVITVSRGLLNIVPNDSVLVVMLAHQMAHIILGHTGSVAQPFHKSVFDLGGNKEFAGFGIRWRPDEEAAADSEAIVLLKGSHYKDAIPNASAFLSQLESESHRFPNLVRARFGVGVISDITTRASKEPTGAADFRFENRFRVSLSRVVIGPEKEQAHSEGKGARMSQSQIQLRR